MSQELERRRLQTLKRSLPRSGDYIALGVTLFIVRLALTHLFLWGLLPIIGMWLVRLDKRLLGWGFVLSVLLVVHWGVLEMRPITVPKEGTIIHVEDTKHTLKTSEGTFYLYVGTAPLNPGSTVRATFQLLPENASSLIGGFDQSKYLKSQNIRGTLYAKTVDVTDYKAPNIRLPEKVQAYIDREFSTLKPYMTAFFLGSTDGFDEDLITPIRALGIAHIFAVSGLHVGLLALALELILKKIPRDLRLLIISGILGIYLVLTDFSVSLMRASLLYGFIQLNRRFKGTLTPLDGLGLLIIGSVLITPNVVYQPAFLLSYSVTLILLLMAPTLLLKGAPVRVSIYAFMTTLPLIMMMSGSVNLSSIFLNIIAVIVLGFYLLPLSYITFFIPALEVIVDPLFMGFETMLLWAYEWVYIPVSVPFTFGVFALFYYAGWVIILITSKGSMYRLITGSSVLIAAGFIVSSLAFYPVLSVLDVDGDSFLYQAPFNRCNILIDGGTEMTSEALKTHLKNHGINHFQVLITTHDDADHADGIEALMNDPYFTWDDHITPENIPEALACGDALLTFDLPARSYPSKNEQSVVVTLERKGWSGLFTGDIEALREADFVERPVPAIDFLKVSHHGSKSSTSDVFLDHVNPDIALINLPHANRFDFPSDEVIDRLESRDIEIFRTDVHGTTRFIIGPKWTLSLPAFWP